jgi:hypothetical protein
VINTQVSTEPLKAIDDGGDLRLEEAVPALMRLVMTKWGGTWGLVPPRPQRTGKITGTAEPAG